MSLAKKSVMISIVILVGICSFLFFSTEAKGMNKRSIKTEQQSAYLTHKMTDVCTRNTQQRVHRVNKAAFCVTNWGFFGSESELRFESEGGCFKPNPESSTDPAESFEYPIGSNVSYLYQGGLWFGAIVPGKDKLGHDKLDTLVSLGCEGWQHLNELFPDGPAPAGAIIERTTRSIVPNMQYADACTSSEAVSEQDIISVYDDLLTPLGGCSEAQVDEMDGKSHDAHVPIGIGITQKSYAWSYSYAEDFFLIDFWIKNVNKEDTIRDIYLGMYIDADVGHSDIPIIYEDDITGFLDSLENPKTGKKEEIATAWIADNDGDPADGKFNYKSSTSVTGTRVVRKPPAPPGTELLPDSLQFSTAFNWWISPQDGGDLDWGPKWQSNLQRWYDKKAYGEASYAWPNNLKGTPTGDITKYFLMSNREWDYDQIYTKVDKTSEGWAEPPDDATAGTIAGGWDTRYLFSFGPIYSIAPGESIPLTVGYIAGENFHTKPLNKSNLPNNPDEYKRNLDFSDFATNSKWASWVYDNPVFDTDGDGFPDSGDGNPDFKGPPPPPAPELSFTVTQGEVTFNWNGKETERYTNSFTQKKDFEGYRVYMAEAKIGAEYSLIHSADRVDFQLWKLKDSTVTTSPKFEYKFPSVLAESLQSWFWTSATLEQTFDSIKVHSDSINGLTYTGPTKTIAVGGSSDEKLEIRSGDKLFFRLQDWNRGFAEIAKYPLYRDSVDNGWVTDTLDKYWDYEYTVSGLLPSRQMSFAVTAFSYGNPSTNLDPLESSKSINETKVYALSPAEEVKAKGKKVVVYPNPYRVDGNYRDLGFEDPDKSGWTEFDRRLWFVNLPSYCKIRIYTLDGDLVREITHDGRGLTNPTMEYWNLISRNTQAVVSGIYLFSVEDLETGQNQIGKFVIIK